MLIAYGEEIFLAGFDFDRLGQGNFHKSVLFEFCHVGVGRSDNYAVFVDESCHFDYRAIGKSLDSLYFLADGIHKVGGGELGAGIGFDAFLRIGNGRGIAVVVFAVVPAKLFLCRGRQPGEGYIVERHLSLNGMRSTGFGITAHRHDTHGECRSQGLCKLYLHNMIE